MPFEKPIHSSGTLNAFIVRNYTVKTHVKELFLLRVFFYMTK